MNGSSPVATRAQDQPAPRQRDYIGKVQTSGQHLLGLLNDILDFSNIEAGSRSRAKRVLAGATLDNTADLVSEKCHAKGLELLCDVAPDVPQQLIGDSLRLGQVLLNLANNAVKFTEHGEVAISVRTSERTDTSVLLHFRVRDTGIGLTPAQIQGLFQSFSQADASTTRKFGGTGLGLAICKQLVELMVGSGRGRDPVRAAFLVKCGWRRPRSSSVRRAGPARRRAWWWTKHARAQITRDVARDAFGWRIYGGASRGEVRQASQEDASISPI